MAYKPNYHNRAFRRRAKLALAFVEQFVKDTPNWLSKSQIDHPNHFGSSSNPLSRWLRTELLTVVNDHYNMHIGQCKTYKLNREGYVKLKRCLNIAKDEPVLSDVQRRELASTAWTYHERSNRYYNCLQYIPTPMRRPLMAQRGFRYNYDIVCAAPTLIRQYADQLGFKGTTPCLDTYIHDRRTVRARISQELEISERSAKKIIHAIVNGAPIGCNHRWRIFAELNYEASKIIWLQQDPWICGLRQEVRACWTTIKQYHGSKMKFDARAKSHIYRQLEQRVMNAAVKELRRQGISNPFREHDGWRCDQMVDQLTLRAAIKRSTGFIVDFDFEIYEYV